MSGGQLNLHTDERTLQTELEFIAMFSGMSEAAPDIGEILSTDDFYMAAMGKCYRFLMEKYGRDRKFIPEDMLNFVRDTEGEEALRSVKAAIAEVITFSEDGVVSRARRIRQCSLWRQAQEAARDISYSTPDMIEDVLEAALQTLSGLSLNNTEETMKPIQDTLADFVAEKTSGKTKGIIPTGYPRLDGILSMSRGDLVVIAARPGVGKSAFVGNLAVKFSLNGYKTVLFSMEMSREQILNRMISSVGQIPHDFLVKNSVYGRYTEDMGKAASLLYGKCGLAIDDKSCLTAGEIKRKSIKAKADVVIVDYLQLMKSARKYEMTNEQLADFIKEGGNDELIPVLWEKTRKLLYAFASRYFSEHRDTMERCGITLPDLMQECYCVFADALKAYDKSKGYDFAAYFKYPFINTIRRLTNCRNSLNTAKSINEPVGYENDMAELADLLHDEHSLVSSSEDSKRRKTDPLYILNIYLCCKAIRMPHNRQELIFNETYRTKHKPSKNGFVVALRGCCFF